MKLQELRVGSRSIADLGATFGCRTRRENEKLLGKGRSMHGKGIALVILMEIWQDSSIQIDWVQTLRVFGRDDQPAK